MLKTLKLIRKMRKMNLQQLSKITGINRQRISLIERGKVNPSFNTVNAIAEALNAKIIITIEP